jgi:hypothetical protein
MVSGTRFCEAGENTEEPPLKVCRIANCLPRSNTGVSV